MGRSLQIIVYLDEPLARVVRSTANARQLSASALARSLIEDGLGQSDRKNDQLSTSLTRLQIAVDALVKHHPNEKLFGIVRATQQAKCGSRSDEA